jgi:hypothetical protein
VKTMPTGLGSLADPEVSCYERSDGPVLEVAMERRTPA